MGDERKRPGLENPRRDPEDSGEPSDSIIHRAGDPIAAKADEIRDFLGVDRVRKLLSPIALWRKAIVAADLLPTVRHVALTLSLHMSRDGDSCFPSLDLLAEETGRHRATVAKAINFLVRLGWLRRWRQGGHQMESGGTPNQYEALWPNTQLDVSRPSQEENSRQSATVAGGEQSARKRPSQTAVPTVASGESTVAPGEATVASRDGGGSQEVVREVVKEGAAPKKRRRASYQKEIQRLRPLQTVLAAEDLRPDVSEVGLVRFLKAIIESPDRVWPDSVLKNFSISAKARVEALKAEELAKTIRKEETWRESNT